MTPACIMAAEALADLLARENAALLALDLARATALLGEKTTATAALQRALQADGTAGRMSAAQQKQATQLVARLRELGEDNARLLQRAIAVQSRVIDVIARAVPKAMATSTARYGAGGNLTTARRVQAVAFSARA